MEGYTSDDVNGASTFHVSLPPSITQNNNSSPYSENSYNSWPKGEFRDGYVVRRLKGDGIYNSYDGTNFIAVIFCMTRKGDIVLHGLLYFEKNVMEHHLE